MNNPFNKPLQPLVSVVMSVYRDGKHLAESIESVLSQSFSDIEFIIVDDGSDCPAIKSILKSYAEQDNRLVIFAKTNEGLTKALIDGCLKARGKYIARIDVGDIMLPSRIEKQVALLEGDRALSMVSVWTSFHTSIWEALWVSQGKSFDTVCDAVTGATNGDVSHHGSVMFRTIDYHAVGGYRWQFYYGQDWDLWYRLGKLGGHQVVPEVLYKARVFPDSISMTQKAHQEEIAKLSHRAAQIADVNELAVVLNSAASIRPSLEYSRYESGKIRLAQGNYFIGKVLFDNRESSSRDYFLRAALSHPWNFKYLGFYFLSVFVTKKRKKLKS